MIAIGLLKLDRRTLHQLIMNLRTTKKGELSPNKCSTPSIKILENLGCDELSKFMEDKLLPYCCVASGKISVLCMHLPILPNNGEQLLAARIHHQY